MGEHKVRPYEMNLFAPMKRTCCPLSLRNELVGANLVFALPFHPSPLRQETKNPCAATSPAGVFVLQVWHTLREGGQDVFRYGFGFLVGHGLGVELVHAGTRVAHLGHDVLLGLDAVS